MKTFNFDAEGNLTVTEATQGKDANGNIVQYGGSRYISAGQVAAHLPMFASEMPADVLSRAKAVANR